MGNKFGDTVKEFSNDVNALEKKLKEQKEQKETYNIKKYPIIFKGGNYRLVPLKKQGGFKFITLEKFNGVDKKPSPNMATIKYSIKENLNISINFSEGNEIIHDVHKIYQIERSEFAAPGLGIVLLKQYKRHIMDYCDIVFLQNEAHTLDGDPNFGYYSSKKNQFADVYGPTMIHSYFIKGKDIRKLTIKTLNDLVKKVGKFFGN